MSSRWIIAVPCAVTHLQCKFGIRPLFVLGISLNKKEILKYKIRLTVLAPFSVTLFFFSSFIVHLSFVLSLQINAWKILTRTRSPEWSEYYSQMFATHDRIWSISHVMPHWSGTMQMLYAEKACRLKTIISNRGSQQ